MVVVLQFQNSVLSHSRRQGNWKHCPQNKCAVVYGTVDKPTIITRNDAKLAAMVMDSVRKAVEIIRNVESAATDGGKDIPVVLHYFSNGGAFIVENLG